MKNSEYSFLFHQMSKDLERGHAPISVSPLDWPDEWRVIRYKNYPRLPNVHLPRTDRENVSTLKILASRRSTHAFSDKPVMLDDISTLLQYSCGISSETQQINGKISERKRALRVQPSAGSLFPIESYVLVRSITEGLMPGLYHYNVKMHTLELLWEKQFSDEELAKYLIDSAQMNAPVIFFLTAVFSRTQSKYGERGYRHVLLEAGHIGQNLHLVSEVLDLGCCAIGGTNDREIENLLDIDGVNESLVYTLGIGFPAE